MLRRAKRYSACNLHGVDGIGVCELRNLFVIFGSSEGEVLDLW